MLYFLVVSFLYVFIFMGLIYQKVSVRKSSARAEWQNVKAPYPKMGLGGGQVEPL